MAYKLKNGVFAVRCRHPGCSFDTQIKIETNLVGATEKDVELEATKIARDMANTKHHALYGTSHYLDNPIIRKVAGHYERFGPKR